MSYSYKVGNNGPTLEFDDAVKISHDSFSKCGMFSDDEWKVHYTAPVKVELPQLTSEPAQ